jgi:hypothetical protein
MCPKSPRRTHAAFCRRQWVFTVRTPHQYLRLRPFRIGQIEVRMWRMAKKTEMSDSSLWIVVIVLLALTAWMFFKR